MTEFVLLAIIYGMPVVLLILLGIASVASRIKGRLSNATENLTLDELLERVEQGQP
ncbi:hypothetical protein KDA14_06035 [Candidatus Saccharibacteria bacterium]|nr:hypothetical protein [Candidatus Saccharibacteria bacterium]